MESLSKTTIFTQLGTLIWELKQVSGLSLKRFK
jgi:hypothetical protein